MQWILFIIGILVLAVLWTYSRKAGAIFLAIVVLWLLFTASDRGLIGTRKVQ